MKRFISIFLFSIFVSNMTAQKISYIEETHSWYYIYDQDGKRVHTFSTSQGRVVAYTSEFYIVRHGDSWYYTYDIKGHRIHTFSVSSTGEVLSASGDTFVARKGSWINTWTKDGKRISTRSAPSR